jgi:hypothetical protein
MKKTGIFAIGMSVVVLGTIMASINLHWALSGRYELIPWIAYDICLIAVGFIIIKLA